ncbi:MAG: TraB/GumN family protein [Bacteroidia bacterium]|nr:TraB/GumN family protein [Bacteroidia bacterium]
MKRLLYILILLPFFNFSQAQKKYPTLLWKITGNGLKKPSYLYGTMHVSSRVAYHLSEQFFDAIKSVDVVGLETNPGEWLQNMEKTGELDQANQIVQSNSYRKDFYRSTFMVNFPDKRMLQGILSYDPDIINGLLYRHNRSKENFEENTYIDLFIFQSASKLNKQLISLEDFAKSEIKARLSALPDDELNEEDDNSQNSSNYYFNGQKIEDSYRDGNLDLLDSLSKKTSSKNTQKFLINDRNVFFVNTIDSVLKTKSLFSGVGAAHLPGDDGVIELLRKKGYTVEPVFPKNSKKSDATRDELDAMVKPVTFQKQFVNDSTISMNLPGKLTQIVNFETIKYYIYADMINGSFYTVARLKHFGPLFNVSTPQMMQKVDSLLFENIPGKIITKKEITSNNGLKGFEIVNKTRRGDEQHYQIFFSDLEMIMFKLGGKQSYATGSESKQFFNSIQFLPKTQNTIEFSPKTKGFTVKVPANYSYTKNSGSGQRGLTEDLYAYNSNQKQFYGVKHAVYNDFEYLEEDTFELNLFSKNILKNYNFSENISRSLTKEQNLPCIKFLAKNKTGSCFYGKLFIKGVHYYLAYFISERESDFNNDFFNSFKLIDFEFINPIKEITDDDYYFKVKDEVTVNATSKFNEAYAKEYEIAKVKKDKVVSDFDYRSGNKSYYSPSSNEYVNITFEKYNDYDYRNIDEIEQSITTSIKNTTGLLITNKTTDNKNGIYTYTCSLKDTATSRIMDVKIFFKNGVMHEIIAPYDSIIGLRGWTKDFMSSFTPKDTVVGKNIFENKFNTLLKDLSSSDTVVRQRANTSLLNSISMNKVYVDEFIKFIGSKDLSLVNEDSRAQLFVNGGTMNSNKIIEPYKNLYKQYTDSFYLQLCMLKGLAYLKTPASFQTFNNLILNETPLVGDVSIVSDVFAVLHDSLELCKSFFPGIMVLTKYDEYKDAVYTLMAEMVNKKIITSATYLTQKDNILADANLALKRYNPSSSKASGDYNEYDYLDKSIKDLAESIQQSLDGFTNNNLFKGSEYLKGLETFNRNPLVNYGIILAPFYKTDEKTKQFFVKLSKIKTQNIAMPVAINLLKNNIVINDTLIDFYAKNKFTRAYFYTELEKEKLTDKFNKKYLTQQSLIESVLTAQTQLSNMYSYDKDKGKKDSLLFIKELDAKNKYQKGKMYVYRIVKAKADDERWSVAFVPESKTGLSSNIQVINSGYYIDKTKTEAENYNEILDYFNLTYRKRAITSTSGY